MQLHLRPDMVGWGLGARRQGYENPVGDGGWWLVAPGRVEWGCLKPTAYKPPDGKYPEGITETRLRTGPAGGSSAAGMSARGQMGAERRSQRGQAPWDGTWASHAFHHGPRPNISTLQVGALVGQLAAAERDAAAASAASAAERERLAAELGAARLMAAARGRGGEALHAQLAKVGQRGMGTEDRGRGLRAGPGPGRLVRVGAQLAQVGKRG